MARHLGNTDIIERL